MAAKAKSGLVMRIIDLVAGILSAGAAGALLLSYLAPYVDPNRWWLVAYFGLIEPLLYLANLIFMLYWAVRWKRFFFVCAAVFLLGIGTVSNFYRFSVSKSYAEIPKADLLKILTFNVEGFVAYDPEMQRSRSTAPEILEFVREADPDIVCFQEYQSTPQHPQEEIDRMLEKWPHRRINYTVGSGERGILGVALYSKFPILSSGEIRFEGSSNGAVYAEVLAGKTDTLRIVANHLETTYVDRGNVAFLDYHNFSRSENKSDEIRRIAGRLRKGFLKRAIQADSMARLIASRNVPTIVCGDFNDTPGSYVYRKVRGNYRDAFEEKGNGFGYTYKGLYRILRIDYILHSEELETLDYESPDVPWSDHNPVKATLRFRRDPDRAGGR